MIENLVPPLSELCKYPTLNAGREFCRRRTGGVLCYLHQGEPAMFTVYKTTPASNAEWLKRFRNELARTARQLCRRWLETGKVDGGCKELKGRLLSEWCLRCRAIRILDQERRGLFT